MATLYAGALSGPKYAGSAGPGIGVLSAAAAYAGAGRHCLPAAAGLTAAVWLVLSLLAYARAKSTSLLDQLALGLAVTPPAPQTPTRTRAAPPIQLNKRGAAHHLPK